MTYKSQVNQSTNQPINQLTVIPYVSIYNWFMQKPIHLTCEHLSNPLGLDEIQPRLSWQFAANAGLKKQTAYQIIAANSLAALQAEVGDVWDSGRVCSDQSHLVAYDGPALASRQRVYWKVRAWNEAGEGSDWSDVAYWEMALLHPQDWQAAWIEAPWSGGPRTTSPAPYMRRVFSLPAPPIRARLYVSALGVFRASLNGTRVGNDDFAPGWTNYHKRVNYCTYDVTDLLQVGDNALGAILGDGWYCGHTSWYHRQMYGERPRFLAQLEVELANGERVCLNTDATWQVSTGPILESDMLMGESVDARREMPGWDTPNFDDSRWQGVALFTDPGLTRSAFVGEPVRPICELPPIAPPQRRKNHVWNIHTFDLGQNFSGRIRLKVSGKRGDTLTLRYAEALNPDGSVYTANLRSARVTDHYTLKGDGVEVYESFFTFHGFRYVEIKGLADDVPADTVTGIILHNDMRQTGSFSCSNTLLNQLQHNIEWGQRGNYLDVPTDCPQRDERMGWTGDAQMFIRTAAFNFNVAPFFSRWQRVMDDEQGENGAIPAVIPNTDPTFVPDGGPAWSDAAIICPWTVYRCYNDTGILRQHYATMQRFMVYLAATVQNDIRTYPDYAGWHGFGDWLSINSETPKDLIGTAFYAHDAELMAQIATVLGKPDDAAHYAALFKRVKTAFNRRFVTAEGWVGTGSQTCFVLALHFNLLPAALRPLATEALVRDIQRRNTHLSTGFVGTPYLTHVLANHGRLDVAYALLEQTTCPSWLYPVTQGATTIWERWDSFHHERGFGDVGMNSFNHYAYGAIGEWLYQVAAGIELDDKCAGYQHFVLRPRPGGTLTHASAQYQSPYGEIMSDWAIKNGQFEWYVRVPPNSTALAVLPFTNAAHELWAGDYHFVATIP